MVSLENGKIRLIIRPDLGGRIDQLQDLITGREWLWHPPDYNEQTRTLAIGESFDQHWSGGWDEIFPNDAAGPFQGQNLVDHGEFWSQSWQVIAKTENSITLQYQCQTVPVQVQKKIQVHETLPEAQIDYWFQNQSHDRIPFLFKQHAAIAIEAGDEIILPACLIEPVDLGFSKIIGQHEKTCFPTAFDRDRNPIEVNQIPPASSKLQEFYYSSDLAIGHCGIRHQKSQSLLIFSFDRADFPYVWVFQSYGGWQGHYVIVLEPCTNIPWDLEVAQQNGTCAILEPQEMQHRVLTVRLQQSKLIQK